MNFKNFGMVNCLYSHTVNYIIIMSNCIQGMLINNYELWYGKLLSQAVKYEYINVHYTFHFLLVHPLGSGL